MRFCRVTLILALAAGGPLIRNGRAQEAAEDVHRQPKQTIDVFLDCQTFYCDFDHFRREIDYVYWVRDRRDADVHVLGTHRDTGGGGREHTLTFNGQGAFGGQTDTLVYVSVNTDTEAEIRDGISRTLQLGLVRFVARTPIAERLTVSYDAPTRSAEPPHDPWNLWVFTLGLNGNLSAQSEQRLFAGSGVVHANRTAEDWKIDVVLTGRASRDETDVPEVDTTFVNTQEFFSIDGLVVRSLGEHWSAGVRAFVGSSTFINTDLTMQAGPALEYSLYPYSESTRRQLTLLYTIGVAGFEYDEETVFGVTSEVRPKQVLEISLVIQELWGSANAALQAAQFLHDLSKHRVDLGGGLSVRVVRGIDISIFGGVSRVKDQLFLSGAGLTPEERLLRTRQFETDFFLFGGIGFRFRFGSKLANVVNPRMSSVTGGSIF